MRITIKDIAKRFNVHHSTVSRALKDDPRIKAETRDKIQRYAVENGYQLNINALKLRGKVRNSIALIVPNVNHRFFSNIINHLTNLAYKHNFLLSIYQSNENLEMEKSILDKIIQQGIDGVIVSVSDKTKSGNHFLELKKRNIPIVFFDRVLFDVDASRVTTKNSEVFHLLVNHFVAKNHKRIAHVSGPDHITVFHDRNLCYQNAIAAHQLKYKKQIIVMDDFNEKAGEEAAKELFSFEEKPDALISTSFFLTMGIIKYLNTNNINIPNEVMVAGFGDRLFHSILHSSLISIEQPEEEMANTAFQLLMDLMTALDTGSSDCYKEVVLANTLLCE